MPVPTNMVDPVDTPSPAMVTQAPKMATQLQSPSPTMDSPHLQAAAPSTSSGSSDWMVVLLAAGVAIGAAGMATSSSNTSFDTHDWRSWVAAYGLGVWSMMIVWNLAAAVIATRHYARRYNRSTTTAGAQIVRKRRARSPEREAVAPEPRRLSPRRHNKRSRSADSDASVMTTAAAVGVSILRPLCGIDPNLEDNLVANFLIDYDGGPFEVLLCVADANDPSIAVARRVMERFPDVDARLVVASYTVGPNPKINNLIEAYQTAKYDIIWTCDSNVFIERDTLKIGAEYFRDPSVGLVHHAPQGVDADTFGAACEWMFLNTAHTKIYLPINAMAVASCVIGKSLMFRRSALNRAIGGLEALSVYMSEDNQIGIGILKAGLRHRLSVCTAKQPLGVGTFRSYMDRRVRWTRIRAWSMPAVTFLEPWYECLFSGLTGALALHHFYDMPMLSVFVAHVLYWFICDLVMVRGLTQKSRPWPSLWWFVRAWIVRELSALPIYIYALSTGRRVTWRGKEYLLQVGGTVVEVDKGGPNVAASVKR